MPPVFLPSVIPWGSPKRAVPQRGAIGCVQPGRMMWTSCVEGSPVLAVRWKRRARDRNFEVRLRLVDVDDEASAL